MFILMFLPHPTRDSHRPHVNIPGKSCSYTISKNLLNHFLMTSQRPSSLLAATVSGLSTGINYATSAEDFLEKCCNLGGSWAGQKLRCEKFTGPVPGVSPDEEAACLEAVDICCRKSFQELSCEEGKADAKAGLACTRQETGARRTPVGLGDYRRDCCEGCKLGILTGASGKGCASKKFSLGIPWDPAFAECCIESMTSVTQDSSTTTSTQSTSTSTSSSAASSSESEEFDDDIDSYTDSDTLNTFKSDDLCQLMKGLLCSEICVPTPGSYYCKCHEGSILEADGRSCKSNTTTTAFTPNTTTPSVPADATTSLIITSMLSTITEYVTSLAPLTTSESLETTKTSNTSTPSELSSSTSSQNPTTFTAKNSTKAISPASMLKLLTTGAKSRTTRSVPTEDNELNLPCPAGYRFVPSTESCDDIDECSEGPITPCPFGSSCENTNGSYRCVRSSQKDRIGELCEIGYRWNSTLGRCSDVNECLENLHKCMIETENCKNLDGSYECEIKCETGFVFNGNYGVCLDINECIELSNVCPQVDTICINTLGSYECKGLREYQQLYESSLVENGTDDRRSNYYESIDEGGREMICAFGFEYNSDLKRCDDIDECRVHEQPCAPGETCRNTIGGYDCIPSGCPRGFSLVNDTCQDVNECELNQHSCAAHERCQNTNGSYTCEPPRPTRRPATTEAPSIICRKGYKVDSVLGRCVDVDECVEGPGCRDHERCHNLQGGYDCSPLCGPGWYFHFQTKTCQDVDECLIGQHNCRQRRQYCRNTNGSYVCEALTPCQSGYRRAYNGSCIDVDECQESLHSCNRETHRYCVNLNGSYECIVRLPPCPRGFEYSLLTSQCEDVDECRRGIAKCDTERYNERCVNLPGSYRCERPIPRAPKRRPACPAGLTYDVTLRRCSGKSAETVD